MVLILNFLNFISGIRTLPQRKMNKRKGGAEKERIRNKTSLKNHAHKYQKFNLHSLAYSNLFLAYKFVLTLSSSQVACERSFSKLKYILNRLRNLLSQSSLQSFMLMSCEKDLLPRINNNEIIDFLASTSETMKKLL